MRIRLGTRRVDLATGVIAGRAPGEHLTPIERRLLRRLAEAPGAVTADQLLADVWGYAPGVNTRTLVTTVSRVRKKIEPDPARPVHLVTARDLGDPTGNAYRLAWTADAGPGRPPPVPPPLTPTCGREAELARLDRHHAAGARLLTLLGPGGIGKTHVARVWASRRPGEVRWLDGETERGVEALAGAVAARLGVADPGRDPVGHAERLLADDAPGWWVLDNMEQIDGLGPVLLRWLEAAPGLRLLLTSRRPLVVPGEVVLELGPLPEPDAVALLAAGCEARDAAVGPDAAATLAAIARAVDGHPLALELATAWTGWLPLDEVRLRVEQDTAALSAPGPGGRKSLAACFARSWDQLSPAGRVALARATALPAGFDLRLARRVLADAPAQAEAALAELRAHSLSRLEGARYRVLVPIREFAAAAAPEQALIGEERAADALTEALAGDVGEPCLFHEVSAQRFDAWEPDFPNLRHLLHRVSVRGDDGRAAALLAGMLPFFPFRLPWSEGIARVEQLRARARPGETPGGPAAWAGVHRLRARALVVSARNAEGPTAHLEAAALYDAAGLAVQAHGARCEAVNAAASAEDAAVCAAALAALDATDPRPTEPDSVAWECLSRAWASYAFGGDPSTLDTLAVAASRASPRMSMEVTRLLITGWADVGRHREAVEWGRAQAARAAELGAPDGGMVLRNRLLRIASGRAELEAAIVEARFLLPIARRYEAIVNLRMLQRALVWAHHELDDVEGAEAALVDLREVERAHGATPYERAATDLAAAELAWSRGRSALAVDLARRSVAGLAPSRSSRTGLEVGLRAARVLAAAGATADAHARLESLVGSSALAVSPLLAARVEGWWALTAAPGPAACAGAARARARVPAADEAGVLALLALADARAAGAPAPAVDPEVVATSLELRMALAVRAEAAPAA